MLWGYASSALKRAPRYDDAAFRRFLRRYQHACLRLGKRAATRRINEEQAAVWRATHPVAGTKGLGGGIHAAP